MTTKRPRHMITETSRELKGDAIAGRRAHSRPAESVRSRSIPIEVEAADEVKRLRLPS